MDTINEIRMMFFVEQYVSEHPSVGTLNDFLMGLIFILQIALILLMFLNNEE